MKGGGDKELRTFAGKYEHEENRCTVGSDLNRKAKPILLFRNPFLHHITFVIFSSYDFNYDG